jgi:hypothetical protein
MEVGCSLQRDDERKKILWKDLMNKLTQERWNYNAKKGFERRFNEKKK